MRRRSSGRRTRTRSPARSATSTSCRRHSTHPSPCSDDEQLRAGRGCRAPELGAATAIVTAPASVGRQQRAQHARRRLTSSFSRRLRLRIHVTPHGAPARPTRSIQTVETPPALPASGAAAAAADGGRRGRLGAARVGMLGRGRRRHALAALRRGAAASFALRSQRRSARACAGLEPLLDPEHCRSPIRSQCRRLPVRPAAGATTGSTSAGPERRAAGAAAARPATKQFAFDGAPGICDDRVDRDVDERARQAARSAAAARSLGPCSPRSRGTGRASRPCRDRSPSSARGRTNTSTGSTRADRAR